MNLIEKALSLLQSAPEECLDDLLKELGWSNEREQKLDVLRVELKAENGLNPSSWEEEINLP